MNPLEIITTGDGSHSLLNTALNETYHSVHGAMQESRHVFIRQGLEHLLRHKRSDAIEILEVGFGTGLNVFLALLFSKDTGRAIHYTAVENAPLAEKVWQALNYGNTNEARADFEIVHRAAWNKPEVLTPGFTLAKQLGDIHQVALPSSGYDLVFFDAFGPAKQPDMWELPLLRKIAEAMKRGGIFVTYCARGQVKRDLKTAGLQVETLPGAPGKKEMIRAVKP